MDFFPKNTPLTPKTLHEDILKNLSYLISLYKRQPSKDKEYDEKITMIEDLVSTTPPHIPEKPNQQSESSQFAPRSKLRGN